MFRELVCGRMRLQLDRPLIMGIVNCTPDSFSGDGVGDDSASAVERARQMIADGADILDVGGESTRPGAAAVDEQEELRRVIPVIEALHDCGVVLSIDTAKPVVMQRAVAAGANFINDINALRAHGALAVAARTEAAVCLMHMQGTPRNMQERPRYQDVVAEVAAFLAARVAAAREAGIAAERIVIDPGFGFGKTADHNLELLRHLDKPLFSGFPMLIGLSRKSLLGQLTGRKVTERLPASIAAALVGVARGANIVRVHDVAATRDALEVWLAATRQPSISG